MVRCAHHLLLASNDLFDVTCSDSLDVVFESRSERIKAVWNAMKEVVDSVEVVFLVLVEKPLEFLLQ